MMRKLVTRLATLYESRPALALTTDELCAELGVPACSLRQAMYELRRYQGVKVHAVKVWRIKR